MLAPEAATDEPASSIDLGPVEPAGRHRVYGVGLPRDVRIEDLDPGKMESWTEHQWDRAFYGGLLGLFRESEWPEAARKLTEDETNGTCPIRQDISSAEPAPENEAGLPPATGLARVRAEYASRFEPEQEEPDEEPSHVWQDEHLQLRVTDYPPPDGFDGYEEGVWGDRDYKRGLASEEQAVVDGQLAELRAGQEAERAAALAAARAARDFAFGFAGGAEETATVEPAAQSDITDPEIREGDAG